MRYFEIVQPLNEMIVRTSQKIEEWCWLFAYRESIWIFGNNFIPDELQSMCSALGINYNSSDDPDSIREQCESRPDILVGHITNKKLSIDTISGQNPYTSSLIKKVVKQLKLKGVIVNGNDTNGDEDEYMVSKNKMVGNIPDILYHGTNNKYAKRICKIGLDPNVEHGNWDKQGIKHHYVFLAADPRLAMFHAYNSCNLSDEIPVIFEVRVPDKSQLIIDYDVANSMYGQEHPEVSKLGYNLKNEYGLEQAEIIQQHSGDIDLNTQMGIFGYRLRISPTNFTRILTPLIPKEYEVVRLEKWKKFTKIETFLKNLYRYEDYY